MLQNFTTAELKVLAALAEREAHDTLTAEHCKAYMILSRRVRALIPSDVRHHVIIQAPSLLRVINLMTRMFPHDPILQIQSCGEDYHKVSNLTDDQVLHIQNNLHRYKNIVLVCVDRELDEVLG
jgi:hypothetical protein